MHKLLILAIAITLLLSVQSSAEPDQPATDKPADKMVHRRSESGLPRFLDPAIAGDVVSSRHVGMLYETLYEYGPFTSSELQPCLAKAMPEVSEDGLTYTIKLREDVYFAPDACFNPKAKNDVFGSGNIYEPTKGPQMTATDITYGIKRLACIRRSGFWVVEGKIVGLDALRKRAVRKFEDSHCYTGKFSDFAENAEVSGLKALDKFTVQIKLNRPYPQLMQALTLSYGAAISPITVKYYGMQLQQHGVGTGAFIQDEISEKRLTYKRNPEYRKVTLSNVPEGHKLKRYEGSSLPLCDSVEFSIIKASEPAWELFMAGKFDLSGISIEQFPSVIDEEALKAGKPNSELLTKELRDKGIELTTYASPSTHYIAFNMADPVVGKSAGAKGKAIRKALALCFDREEYISKFLNSRGQAASSIVPPGIIGHAESTQASQSFDIKAAKKMLTDAGFTLKGDDLKCVDPATGRQVKIEVLYRSTDSITSTRANFFKKLASKVGIDITPKQMTFSEFLGQQDDGAGQAYDAGWVMDLPDSQNMFQLLYGPNRPPGINGSGFNNEEYNNLYEEMAVLDESKPAQLKTKLELIRKMADILEEETPWICVEYSRVFSLQQKGVALPTPNSFRYTSLKYVGISR